MARNVMASNVRAAPPAPAVKKPVSSGRVRRPGRTVLASNGPPIDAGTIRQPAAAPPAAAPPGPEAPASNGGGDGRGFRPARPSMSHRAATLVALTLGILVFRWYTSGKLSKAAKAWAGQGTGNAPKGSNSPGTPGGGSTGNPPGGGDFGLPFTTYSRMAPDQYWSGANAPDRGLVPDESGEWNYGLSPGSQDPIYLPGGGKGWREQSQGMQPGLGGYEVWQDPAGGLLAFLHLSSLWDPTAGTGGQVGVTGWPLSPDFGAGMAGPQNAHLAVVFDPKTRGYIHG